MILMKDRTKRDAQRGATHHVSYMTNDGTILHIDPTPHHPHPSRFMRRRTSD